MADDELSIPIESSFWSKGVMRSLAPLLRTLGETHGNLMIAGLPAKGSIVVKGPSQRIVDAKPALRQLVEEYFPDALVPEQLGGVCSATVATTFAGYPSQHDQLQLSAVGGESLEVQPAQVKLFWKVAVQDLGSLRDMVPLGCGSPLDEVKDPHVTLLFFGGRGEEKAAEKAGLPLQTFQYMNGGLEARAGQTVKLAANAIYTHPDIVFATVSLPPDVPCHNPIPYVKFFVRQGISGDFGLSLLSSPGVRQWRRDLPQPIHLHGTIALEMGDPLPKIKTKSVRPQRFADEVQGQWVHVKKHSSMGCAVVTVPSQVVRDAVFDRCSAVPIQVRGISLDVKPHMERQPNGLRRDVPEALFVGWRQPDHFPLRAAELQSLFDQAIEPWVTSAASWESAHVADTLLRSKAPMGAPGVVVPGLDDDVVVLRLTRLARTPEVTSLLLESPLLANCRERVTAARCEVAPAWAGGAKLLVPLSHQQMEAAGLELEHHHIVAYGYDVDRIKCALAALPCRRRPKLSTERHTNLPPMTPDDEPLFVVECTLRTDSSFGPLSC